MLYFDRTKVATNEEISKIALSDVFKDVIPLFKISFLVINYLFQYILVYFMGKCPYCSKELHLQDFFEISTEETKKGKTRLIVRNFKD